MNEDKTAWIPESYKISARDVMRMLYAIRDFLRAEHKTITNSAFSQIVDRFEDTIRDEMEFVPMRDFQDILEEEDHADNL